MYYRTKYFRKLEKLSIILAKNWHCTFSLYFHTSKGLIQHVQRIQIAQITLPKCAKGLNTQPYMSQKLVLHFFLLLKKIYKYLRHSDMI